VPRKNSPEADRPSTKRRLAGYLASRQPERITEAVWLEVRADLSPVSDSYLRDLLQATQIPFDQPWAGIRQHTLEELESSLRGMLEVYLAAEAAGDRERARYARRQVIAAKDRARFHFAQSPLQPRKTGRERRDGPVDARVAGKPAVFAAWVEARKRLQARV